jgi:hypothetical protein
MPLDSMKPSQKQKSSGCLTAILVTGGFFLLLGMGFIFFIYAICSK